MPYGQSSYGFSPYGTSDSSRVPIERIESISGTVFQVIFSEPVRENAALTDVDSYGLSSILGGVDSSPSAVSVATFNEQGVTSVYVETGYLTLGGHYLVDISGIVSVDGHLYDTTTVSFLSKSTPPTLDVTVFQDRIRIGISENLFDNESISDPYSFGFDTVYPAVPYASSVSYTEDPPSMEVGVIGFTDTGYELTVGKATSVTYDATEVPTGPVIGPGSGESVVTDRGLSVTKNLGSNYGWEFRDGFGRLVDGSTYRADFSYDTNGNFDSGFASAIVWSVSDGVDQIDIIFAPGSLWIRSGSDILYEVSAEWEGEHTVSLVRNQLAQTYCLILDETPIKTFSISESNRQATNVPGTEFYITDSFAAEDFIVSSMKVTASQTLYTASWNFIHEYLFPITGLSSNLTHSIPTEYGPLVKGWGSFVPASASDVTLYVNDVEVEVDSVNPYDGIVYPAIPIPQFPQGGIDVYVDYRWMENPVFPMTGLNTPGLTLNKWDRPFGRNTTSQSTSTKGSFNSRFKYSVGFGRPKAIPAHIGHRFIAYDTAYTSSLNKSLRLNTPAFPNSYPYAVADSQPTSLQHPSADWQAFGNAVANQTVIEGPGYLYNDVDFSSPSVCSTDARLSVGSYSLDGIFTGVFFALGEGKSVAIAGLLEVNGVRHIGFLKGYDVSSIESWTVPFLEEECLSATTISVSNPKAKKGHRFQILQGPQAGVYTVSSIANGVATITGVFPADPNLWGNKEVQVSWETDWRENFTIALDKSESYLCRYGSPIPGTWSIDETVKPAKLGWTPLGSVRFGNWNASDVSSIWNSVRLESSPTLESRISRGTRDISDFESRDQWYPDSLTGQSIVVSSDDMTFLSIGGYTESRLDPFIQRRYTKAVDAWYAQPYGVGNTIRIRDTRKEGVVRSLLYTTSPNALVVPDRFDWNPEAEWDSIPSVNEDSLLRLGSGNAFEIHGSSPNQLLLVDVDPVAGFAVTIHATDQFGIVFDSGSVRIVSGATTIDTVVAEGRHVYQLVVGSTDVVFFIDGVASSTNARTSFTEPAVSNGIHVTASEGTLLHSLSCTDLVSANRTLGIWKGGDESDIDNWCVPRTDTNDVPNSDPSAVITAMDWSSEIQLRVVMDDFGVSIERPDLPMPSGYDASEFATINRNITSAHAYVEYANLPSYITPYGSVTVGSPQTSITEWSRISYEVITDPAETYTVPYNNVLNRSNVLTSGEYLRDTTPETVEISPISPTMVSLIPSHIYASRVFVVVDNDAVVPPSSYQFDIDLQAVFFDSPLSGNPVRITFAPAKPVTNTYLETQPFGQSVTKLNEGTPSFALSQAASVSRNVLSGSRLDSDDSVTSQDASFTLNDPYAFVSLETTGAYDALEMILVEEGVSGMIASAYDQLAAVSVSGSVFSENTIRPQPSLTQISGMGLTSFMPSGGNNPIPLMGGGQIQSFLTYRVSGPSVVFWNLEILP